MKNFIIVIVSMLALLTGCSNRAQDEFQIVENVKEVSSGRVYYVDDENGYDNNDGLSETTALKSLEGVNKLELQAGDSVKFRAGQAFRGQLIPQSGEMNQRITYTRYGEGKNPLLIGSVPFYAIEQDFKAEANNIYSIPSPYDIGNVIVEGGREFGLKVFSYEDLVADYSHYHDPETMTFYVVLPDWVFSGQQLVDIEFCLTQDIVDMRNKSHINFIDLDLKYGGSHGYGGSDTHYVTIEGCEISYIGGGLLFYLDEEPIRYGNGVEVFNTGSNLIVNNCLIHDIFDTGVTNQGSERSAYHDKITYSNNTIYRCGMSAFELWQQGKKSSMTNIEFIGNEVADIGEGFSLTQQRTSTGGLGHFVISFGNRGDLDNIVIEDNVFEGLNQANGMGSIVLLSDLDGSIDDNLIVKAFDDNRASGYDYEISYTRDGRIFHETFE